MSGFFIFPFYDIIESSLKNKNNMSEENKENIITTLKNQHKELIRLTDSILNDLKSENNFNAENIFKSLNIFKEKLIEHLKLENDVFYVDLIEAMEAKKRDVSEIKIFIEGMKNIEKSIYAFFDRYYYQDEISKNRQNFQDDFKGISEQLKLRASSEEADIFSIWENAK